MVRIHFPPAGSPLRTDFRGRIPSMPIGSSPAVGRACRDLVEQVTEVRQRACNITLRMAQPAVPARSAARFMWPSIYDQVDSTAQFLDWLASMLSERLTWFCS